MAAPIVSPQLVEWAADARYAFTPEGHTGAALFWTDPGGETRLYFRYIGGEYVFTQAERVADEQFKQSTPEMEMERYRFSEFAWDVRLYTRLPRVRTANKPEDIAGGYRIGDPDDHGTHESKIEYVLDGQSASLGEVLVKRHGSFSAIKIEFLIDNASLFGYQRVGTTWVEG